MDGSVAFSSNDNKYDGDDKADGNWNGRDWKKLKFGYYSCHRWWKVKSQPGLEPRASGVPCQRSNHWAIETRYIDWQSHTCEPGDINKLNFTQVFIISGLSMSRIPIRNIVWKELRIPKFFE